MIFLENVSAGVGTLETIAILVRVVFSTKAYTPEYLLISMVFTCSHPSNHRVDI